MKLGGKHALVTGASRGLGLAIARALAGEGAAVTCVARAGAELDSAVAALAREGARAVAVAADVTKDGEVAAAVEAAVRAHGALDMVVLNAGTWLPGTVTETSEATWDLLLDLNLKHAFLTLRHALPHVTRPGGTIVGIDSIGGWVGAPNACAYAASKWGLRGLLESVALEVKPERIRVSIVSPDSINSAGSPIEPGSDERARTLDPVDIASVVAHVCTAPPHVAIGNVQVWSIATALRSMS
jgi:NAD(P)-dependent dehydrogenase (short-subunit alcohol dehydrogenase family)